MKNNEQVERGSLENCKKFFSLMFLRKISYSKYTVVSIFSAVNLVLHVLFLEKITHFLEEKNIEMFDTLLVYYICYILGYEIINFSMKKWGWMETIPLGVGDIYKEYLNKYIKLDNNKVEAIGTGKLIGIIEKGSFDWVESLADVVEKGTALLVAFIFTIYMVGKVNIFYGIIFVILMIIFFIIGKYSNKKLWDFRNIRYELRNGRLKLLVKIMMSKIEILQTGKIGGEIRKSYIIAGRLKDVNQKMSFHRVMLKRVSQFGMSLLLFMSFWYLGNKYIEGSIHLSTLVGLTGTLIIMQKTIAESIKFYVDFTKRYVGILKLWDFFEFTPEIKGYETGEIFQYKKGKIEIKNMCFSYDQNMKIFSKFNLEIPGGKVVAFVGNSGSGKSTLVKIISGYLTHDSGDVIIDGQKNKDISLKSLYKHVGYLTQEPSVFDGSILDNLTYGIHGDIDSKKLKEIILLAKCEFIYDFPDGLGTEIGEKGIRLSGGQRQRLAIAKIFFKNPEIIILDEPTSALDSFSEEQITIAMENLFKQRTVIIIAHRLQTVKNADKILVLGNGKVCEEGTHEELINIDGVYKKMLDLQSGF